LGVAGVAWLWCDAALAARPPAHDSVQHLLSHFLPSWLYLIIVAFAYWLVAPPQLAGGLRWMMKWLRGRRPVGDKRRAAARGRFASMMLTQVTRISEAEEWQDEQFTELEAEVEVYGRRRQGLFTRRQPESIRRVPSLSDALEQSTDQIILLEGEPGSGKSVALRHVALRMAAEMKTRPTERGVIPLYLNLKEFRPDGPVDAAAVQNFVLSSLKRANVLTVDRFLEQEFGQGIEEGTWLFLFDSFDEIPAVLGAIEADDVIAEYANGLYDFLTSMNDCRGIIASRDFRGPKRISWPRFRVQRLTGKQRRELIEKLDLPAVVEQRILSGLVDASAGVRQLAENPLFLALLCEYQRDMPEFPSSSHVVFENYVAKRFRDDSSRLSARFGLTSAQVRVVAEQAAFCMSAQADLGLSPRRVALLDAMRSIGYHVDDSTAVALDALEYLKLARSVAGPDGSTDGFTFAHRRFQEYFATCVVMAEATRISPLSLLTDGRWRETAITLFQTQGEDAIQPLLTQATDLLRGMTAQVTALAPGDGPEDDPPPFDWPAGSLHMLGLLQDGLPSGDPRRPADLGELTGKLLTTAGAHGQLHDRRWVTETCLTADPDTAWEIIRQAFASKSGWLREAAYTQTGRLYPIPGDVRQQVRGVLAGLAGGGRLRRQRLDVDAQLRRLPDPRPELLLTWLFILVPFIDAAMWTVLTIAMSVVFGLFGMKLAALAAGALAIHVVVYIDRDDRGLDSEARFTGSLTWFYVLVEIVSGQLWWQPLALFVWLIRLYGALFFWAYATTDGAIFGAYPGGLASVVTGVIIVYAATWAMAANRADRLLAKPDLFKLMVLPLWGVLHACLLAVRKLRSDRSVLVKLTVLVAGIGLVSGLVVYAELHVSEIYSLAGVFPVIGVGFGCAAGLVATCINVYRQRRDREVLARIEHGGLDYTTFAQMLDVLGLFWTQRALLLFLEEVKRRRAHIEHPPALRAMQAFASMNKMWTRNKKPRAAAAGARLEPGELDYLSLWVDARWARKSRRGRRGAVLTQAGQDEIGKMVADAELTTMTRLPIT
jgi:NACHT domain